MYWWRSCLDQPNSGCHAAFSDTPAEYDCYAVSFTLPPTFLEHPGSSAFQSINISNLLFYSINICVVNVNRNRIMFFFMFSPRTSSSESRIFTSSVKDLSPESFGSCRTYREFLQEDLETVWQPYKHLLK